ncbi:MAG: response regulator [Chloroflexales bacterium]|nr:response regulator [Chloroflexales bacterium]
MATILLVEDDEMIRDIISRHLRMAGYSILMASDGARAILLARQEQPDLILMDMGLPILNGWQATRRLKMIPETRAIPIIALTAFAMPEDRERCLQAGCDEFTTKPVDVDQLQSLICRLLSH